MTRTTKISAATAAIAIMAFPSAPCLRAEGSPAYNFLEIPTSAHAYALGGSGIAIIDDDVTLADQNPALIGPELDMQLGFNYMHYMAGGNFAGFRYGMGAGERGAWAVGMRYLGYGAIKRYDADGFNAVGDTFSPTDLVIEGTYAHDFTDRLRGGINLKMAYSNYDARTAVALAADLGISYYDEEHDLSLAAVLKNAGGQLKRFNDHYDSLPIDLQLGYMQGLGNSPFSLAITATNLTRWNLPYYKHDSNNEDVTEMTSNFGSNLFRHLIFGLQYSPSDKFYAALAYNHKTATDMSVYSRNILSGFSLGLGIRVKAFGVSVAYAMPHKSASTLLLNLYCSLGELIYR